MLLKRTSIKLLSSLLLFSTVSVSAEDLSFRSLNLVDNEFSTTTEFWNHVKNNQIQAHEIIAECASYIAVVNPIIQQGGADLHDMNVRLFMMLVNYGVEETKAMSIVEEKAGKYRKLLHNSYEKQDATIIHKFSNGITICKDFYTYATDNL